jgi:hypothetical protein
VETRKVRIPLAEAREAHILVVHTQMAHIRASHIRIRIEGLCADLIRLSAEQKHRDNRQDDVIRDEEMKQWMVIFIQL